MATSRAVILVLFQLMAFGTVAQVGSFHSRISELREQLIAYEALSPWDTLPDIHERIEHLNERILCEMHSLLNDPEILKIDLDSAFDQRFTRSEDKWIWFFAIDDKTGGSYRSSSGLIHWRLPNGQIGTDPLTDPNYSEPLLIDPAKHIYFIASSVITCNTCISMEAIMITLGDEGVDMETIHSFEGRTGDVEVFDLDLSTGEFHFDHSWHPDDSLYGRGDDHISRESGTMKYQDGKFITTVHCQYR